MMEPDKYLEERNVGFTFRKLINHWESLAEELARGETQYYDDYTNDLGARDLIQEILDKGTVAKGTEHVERISVADLIVRNLLVPLKKPFGLNFNSRAEGEPEKYWWYYGRPAKIDSTFEWFLGM